MYTAKFNASFIPGLVTQLLRSMCKMPPDIKENLGSSETSDCNGQPLQCNVSQSSNVQTRKYDKTEGHAYRF
ncbi:hypothetical protein EWB00_001814 [Schistosoma japonicum]|uniref:Uncharacterized protein n=1 Tax=Schistosoma japonicum TaxID=6182 RepID=A0A4Z2CK41_SCHJA|nr:hypothetical protein EWB00_001814 [Schistosoma japonicum]